MISLNGFFGLPALRLASTVDAETIIECGDSNGRGYYFDDDPKTGEPMGWADDAIPNGTIVFVTDGKSVDIIIRDAIGTISAKAEGATVSVIEVRDPFVEVFVSYPKGTKELYTFNLKERRVAWSQHKFGVLFDKISSFTADCR